MRRLSIDGRRVAMPLAWLAAAVLAACGGGGSSDSGRAGALAAKGQGALRQAPAAQADQADGRLAKGMYIVQLAELPVAGYEGGIPGYRATRPQAGKKLDSTSPDVQAYTGYLMGRHDTVMAAAGVSSKAYSYATVFNGFAAELTEA